MVQELEKVAQLTKDEAKQILANEILDETRHDVALQVRNIEQTAKEDAALISASISFFTFSTVSSILAG